MFVSPVLVTSTMCLAAARLKAAVPYQQLYCYCRASFRTFDPVEMEKVEVDNGDISTKVGRTLWVGRI